MVSWLLKDIIITQLVWCCYFIVKCIISLWKKVTFWNVIQATFLFILFKSLCFVLFLFINKNLFIFIYLYYLFICVQYEIIYCI